VTKTAFIYLTLLVGLVTFVLYSYRESQPPDQQQVERCNQLVSQMPESNEEEINRSINTFLECLEN
jgi:predicted histidine transporter YuiF (NhaC family)